MFKDILIRPLFKSAVKNSKNVPEPDPNPMIFVGSSPGKEAAREQYRPCQETNL